MTETGNGTQPGDPTKAAAAILTALDSEATPLRLPLGDDAVDAILGHLDSVRAEITTWEKLARDTRLAQLTGAAAHPGVARVKPGLAE